MCSSVDFSIFTQSPISHRMQPSPPSILKHAHHPLKETLSPVAAAFPASPSEPPSLGSHESTFNLLSDSQELPVLDLSHKWNPTICSLFHLAVVT